MAKKYDCLFCNCGRIHIMDYDEYDWLESSPKRSYIRVCMRCGSTHRVFLTDNGEGFDICSVDVPDGTIVHDINTKIHFSRGIMIPLKSGGYADWRFHDGYANTDYLRDTLGTTYIPEALKKDPLCTTVDTERLIREVKDEDILNSISGYIVGIDWTGTKYDHRKKENGFF